MYLPITTYQSKPQFWLCLRKMFTPATPNFLRSYVKLFAESVVSIQNVHGYSNEAYLSYRDLMMQCLAPSAKDEAIYRESEAYRTKQKYKIAFSISEFGYGVCSSQTHSLCWSNHFDFS